MRHALTALLGVTALAGCTAAPVTDSGVRAPPAQVIGEAVSCLSPGQISESRVRDDYTIDFRVSGGRMYRNTLDSRCSGLGFEERFGYTLNGTQLCSGQIIHVLHSDGSTAGSCALGRFVPIQPVP